jgi:hypothetical protein
MFELNIIQNKISSFFGSSKEIQKSDPMGQSLDNPDQGESNEEILAAEITALLDDGTISPESEKVHKWAVSKGLSEEAAEDFANTVISAYFSDEDEDDMAQEDVNEMEDYEDEETDEDEDDDDMEEVEKSALAELQKLNETNELVLKGMQTMTEALTGAIEKLGSIESENNSLKAEISLMKSKFGELKTTPVNPKSPVTNVQTPISQPDEISLPVVKSWAKDKFMSGNASGIDIQDVAALDQGFISNKIKIQFLKERGTK